MTEKQVQWFPGHMFKSFREMRAKLNLMDLVMVLLDARLPASSMNPEILKIIRLKPVLLLFNKADLADDAVTDHWIRYYQALGYETLKIDAQNGKNVSKIMTSSHRILKEKRDKKTRKGLKQVPVRTMILGIPNVGKSTLINRLAGRRSAKAANTPGVTKAQQWIKVGDDFELLDTPGVLWPKFDDPSVGLKLAATGAIKDAILPFDEVAAYVLSFLNTHYPKRLKDRYGFEGTLSETEIFEHIGKTRGALLKGNEIDHDRVNRIIVTDLRNNQFGGISFDRET